MLSRYQMRRGWRIKDMPIEVQDGRRVDTRKHTRHFLRPPANLVKRYLAAPSASGWGHFAQEYRATLERRFAADQAPFDALRNLAMTEDIFLGCSCPTSKNPDVRRCHTYLALEFMEAKYPDLEVVYPQMPE